MRALILGGMKSGKSRYAENLARQIVDNKKFKASDICLIATAQALDEAMGRRIQKHKDQRPSNWQLIEEPLALSSAIEQASKSSKVILVDCLTLWLTNLLMLEDSLKLQAEIHKLESSLEKIPTDIILVSNETNMGIVPLGELSREFCDQSGRLHQRLAQVCENVSLIVAGLPLHLKKTGEGV